MSESKVDASASTPKASGNEGSKGGAVGAGVDVGGEDLSAAGGVPYDNDGDEDGTSGSVSGRSGSVSAASSSRHGSATGGGSPQRSPPGLGRSGGGGGVHVAVVDAPLFEPKKFKPHPEGQRVEITRWHMEQLVSCMRNPHFERPGPNLPSELAWRDESKEQLWGPPESTAPPATKTPPPAAAGKGQEQQQQKGSAPAAPEEPRPSKKKAMAQRKLILLLRRLRVSPADTVYYREKYKGQVYAFYLDQRVFGSTNKSWGGSCTPSILDYAFNLPCLPVLEAWFEREKPGGSTPKTA